MRHAGCGMRDAGCGLRENVHDGMNRRKRDLFILTDGMWDSFKIIARNGMKNTKSQVMDVVWRNATLTNRKFDKRPE